MQRSTLIQNAQFKNYFNLFWLVFVYVVDFVVVVFLFVCLFFAQSGFVSAN